jgi:hypothetical protein
MARHIDQLRELTETASLAGSLANGSGRYARTPDYTRPVASSSRPKSDRGTTFHFSHKAMSKRNDMSDSNFTHTTSAAHQGYIERPSATEKITPAIADMIQKAPMPDIAEGLIAPGFSYPERIVDPSRASFGTLGASKSERKEFWNQIERHEGKNGRVQNRIIAELPVELNLTERCLAVRDFCQSLEERGLPYWAAIHAPGKRNDKRNYHLHITYFDRPSGQDAQGRWAHAITETRRKKSRHKVVTRPYRSNKHPDTRARGWPKRLRRNYSDTCNFYLSIGSYEKRYDPRPYRESGISKEPTEHLGNKISALETMGLDTVSGQRNAKREIRWKILKAEQPWKDRQEQLLASDAYESASLEARRNAMIKMINAGTKHARKSASLSIMSDMIGGRIEHRMAFLDQEIRRLSEKDDLSDLAARSATIIALTTERDLLEDRAPSLIKTADKCSLLGSQEIKKSLTIMKQFDSEMQLLDPESVFDSEGMNDLDNIEDLTPEDTAVASLNKSDMENIDDLFGPEDIPEPEDEATKIAPEAKDVSKEDLPSPTKTSPMSESDEKQDAAGHPVEVSVSKPEDQPIKHIQDIIGKIANEDINSLAVESDKISPDAFPGAWAIQPTRERDDLEKLDRKLAALDNRQLRHAAIASRDATDLCPAGSVREEFARGWSVLRYEAQRRGLDLDTGVHTPEAASDPERALLHADQDPCPIRVVRKNISRQRVRG